MMTRQKIATLASQIGALRPLLLSTGLALAFALAAPASTATSGDSARAARSVTIPGGFFSPFFADPGTKPDKVEPFRLDRHPVTNAEFATFVLSNPLWKPGAPPEILASGLYLRKWEGRTASQVITDPYFGPRPVTSVSFFAASAYCDAQGGRLPSESEWELVGRASETLLDASKDPEHTRKILAWYERSRQPELEPVGQHAPNAFGIYDMHGLVWEWVSDFNASLIGGARSGPSEKVDGLFCGGGSVDARNPSDYAAFMRYAFRSSLTGNYAMHSLGFRCAYNLETAP